MPATMGIIGFGAFGAFAGGLLAPHFSVLAHDPERPTTAAPPAGVTLGPLELAAGRDVVLLAVPAQRLDDLCVRIAPMLRPGTLVMDVCSVKVRPVEIMRRRLPAHVDIVGTHPLFGPQSGKDSIAGLPIVLCPVRISEHRLAGVRSVLANVLFLQVLDAAPDEHDRAMAAVQGLTHYVARALDALDLPRTPMSTKAYLHLRAIADLLGSDSWALFESIQNENPFAAELRSRLRQELDRLDRRLTPAP